MDIDRDKAIKLVIVAVATLAALAVMGTIFQLIQTILPFLIVGAGVYAGYRWVLSDTAAPTADEVEEQARGLFSRFRKTKDAVETTMKVGAVLSDLQGKATGTSTESDKSDVVQGKVVAKAEPVADDQSASEEDVAEVEATLNKIKQSIESDEDGEIEFNDRDVVISKDDVVTPDISRLEEKEKEIPQVTDNVLSQIEERRRRLQEGRDS